MTVSMDCEIRNEIATAIRNEMVHDTVYTGGR